MDNSPSPYSESEHIVQEQELEMLYGDPHAAGFPQPGYPPTQPMYAEPAQVNYADIQQPGYTGYAGTQYSAYSDTQQPGQAAFWKGWHSLLIALTALALLLLIASGSVYYYLQTRSTPEKTLQAYCSAIKNDDGRALYNTYSSEVQGQTDVPHLQQGLKFIEFVSGGIENCTVDTNSIHENDPHATARVTFTLYSGHLTDAILRLIDEKGQWKVENNTILP